jgi:predicted nucleic acid-binding Zn ribbon protein
MARARRPPEPVRDALQHVLQRIDPDRRLEVFRVWAAEVGEAVAARAAPAAFRDGVLSVHVSSAVWMQELQFAKQEIRDRLNRRLGAEIVRDVYFVSGRSQPTPKRPPAAASVPTADASEPDAASALPTLRNPHLTEIFSRLARTHQRRGRR